MAANKNQGPVNYILDSEPDDDDSDDESKPKHVIPYWAQRTYIYLFFFFFNINRVF